MFRAMIACVLVGLILVVMGPHSAGSDETGQDWSANRAEEAFAAAGDASAQYDVGVSLYYGRGRPQDYVKALYWVTQAANQGHMEAQVLLATIYREGLAVPADTVQVAHWTSLAAEQGHGLSQFSLGVLYMTGDGVPKDLVLAHKWANLAAAQRVLLAEELRADIEEMLTPEEILYAQQMAAKWWQAHQELWD